MYYNDIQITTMKIFLPHNHLAREYNYYTLFLPVDYKQLQVDELGRLSLLLSPQHKWHHSFWVPKPEGKKNKL